MARLRALLPLLLLATVACNGGGEAGPVANATVDHPLAHLDAARVSILGDEFEVWLASAAADRNRGLMAMSAAEFSPLADGTERGMLFVWQNDLRPGFWMRNTIVPLDLAFLRADGTITEIHSLTPFDETVVVSRELVRYALELRAGTLAARGIDSGDVVLIPLGVGAVAGE